MDGCHGRLSWTVVMDGCGTKVIVTAVMEEDDMRTTKTNSVNGAHRLQCWRDRGRSALALGAPSGGRLDYRSERFTLDAGIRRQ